MLGLIGQKLGMTQIFEANGNVIPVSVVKIDDNVVIGKRTVEKDGYNAVILGTIERVEKNTGKALKGFFSTQNVKPVSVIREFRVEKNDQYEVGAQVSFDDLNGVEYVDIVGMSKGKGFQGVVKRHGFHGGRATHGSKFHRQNGSTGQNTYPAHCFKGVKRAGRMGFDRVTIQSLQVVKVDPENKTILIKGAIPGTKNSIVCISKAVKV